MSPKQKKIEMHKITCMSFIYLEALDNLKVSTPRALKLKEDISEFLLILGDEINDTDTVQKTTYFQEITHKIDTILRKSFVEC